MPVTVDEWEVVLGVRVAERGGRLPLRHRGPVELVQLVQLELLGHPPSHCTGGEGLAVEPGEQNDRGPV